MLIRGREAECCPVPGEEGPGGRVERAVVGFGQAGVVDGAVVLHGKEADPGNAVGTDLFSEMRPTLAAVPCRAVDRAGTRSNTGCRPWSAAAHGATRVRRLGYGLSTDERRPFSVYA